MNGADGYALFHDQGHILQMHHGAALSDPMMM